MCYIDLDNNWVESLNEEILRTQRIIISHDWDIRTSLLLTLEI